MSSIQQALIFIVQNLFQLYIFIVLLRFMLQVAKADFYNPLSQFIVKATSMPLKPLRRLVPGIGGFDIASLILALFVQVIMILAVMLILQAKLNPLHIITGSLVGIINSICNIYFFGIIIAAISSFIPAMQHHSIVVLIWQLVEPLMAPFRKIIPPMGGLDISPFFVIMILQVIKILIKPLLLF